jgi:hypothetical protein
MRAALVNDGRAIVKIFVVRTLELAVPLAWPAVSNRLEKGGIQ